METAMLKYSLPEVLQKLRDLLIRQGFIIEKMENNQKLIAFKNGNWFHDAQRVTFEIFSLEKEFTRVDVTANIHGKKKDIDAEEIIAERIVENIYRNFNKNK